MNVVNLLKQDHKKVQALFRQFEAAGDHARKQKEEIAAQTCQELEVHAKLEEEIFYPAVQADTDEKGEALVHEAIEEHAIVKRLVHELRSMSADDEQFEAKYTVLAESVKHHVEEEEGETMPRAEKQLGAERLEELGDQMTQRKHALSEKTRGARETGSAGERPTGTGRSRARKSSTRRSANGSEEKTQHAQRS